MIHVEQAYQSRLKELHHRLSLHIKKRKQLSFLRLASFFTAPVLFFVLLSASGVIATVSAIILFTIFLVVTRKDIDNAKEIRFIEQLIQINEEELLALKGDFSSFDPGETYKNNKHHYTADLDIFGSHGLFQMINRTTISHSADLLADWLQRPASKEKITERQQAVRSLASEMEWRQQLQAIGRNKKTRPTDFEQILSWGKNKPVKTGMKKWDTLTLAALLMTAVFIVLAMIDIVSWQILWLSLIVHALLVWRIGKVVTPHYNLLSKTIASLDALEQRLFLISTKDFGDEKLIALQQELTQDNKKAFQAIRDLKKILERLDIRFNPLVYFPLNFIFFWDWHQYKALVNWHDKTSDFLPRWIAVFVEMEALCSLANLAYNNPEWYFPEIAEQHFELEATEAGHPLIVKEKRVCNSVMLEGTGKLMLITGSNMAGKSTFLRTIGVNIVLAMAGAPVCAEKMRISPVKILSSMRIADNLEENTSTFYAELKKLEMIIEAAGKHEKCLFLMDEVLRGTNSNDRHKGSRALIEQLLKVEAVSILATHDLALADMEDRYPDRVKNYYFDVQVRQEELFFDYRLKKGICNSMNASLLMRKIGIEV